MRDVDQNPTDESAYECFDCGTIVVTDANPGRCDDCGGKVRNRLMPVE